MPSFLCRVDLLDDSYMTVEVPKKSNGSWLLDYVFKALNIGETDYFGLQFTDAKHQLRFLDAEKLVKKQLKNAPQTFRFVAKLYPAGPGDLVEDLTRYLFCLQIKRDLSNGSLPCPLETAALFGSLAVQADLGDYDAELHLDGYLADFEFLANQPEELIRRAEELHQTHAGLTPADADRKFLERACRLDLYGVHLFPVKDYDGRHVHIGISWAGLAVYGGFFPYVTRLRAIAWRNVSELSYDNKKLVVKDRFGEIEWIFRSEHRSGCKILWKACAEHHTFFRRATPSNPKSPLLSHFQASAKFRYSGRTQKQVMAARRAESRQTEFARSSSVRYSTRSWNADYLMDGGGDTRGTFL
ncbi:band 4.1-like protein 1 [Oscarella lobularis]|uniref:band 4.1-like protein 1 n=1 Tax=Oscarella lobularis TaxID=121494 RepID=UPI00331356C3